MAGDIAIKHRRSGCGCELRTTSRVGNVLVIDDMLVLAVEVNAVCEATIETGDSIMLSLVRRACSISVSLNRR